jgi:Fe2+ transport system protein FeoA
VGTVEDAVSLTEIETGERKIIAKIRYDTPEALNYLKSLELVPPSEVTIVERAPVGETVTIRIKGAGGEHEQVVGEGLLERIWVFP